MFCANYSAQRDEDSKQNENKTDEIICDCFKIPREQLINKDGTEADYHGIDRVLPNGETIQKKNLEVYSYEPKYSETVTIPCKNYGEYKKEGINWIFHSYWNKNEPEGVRQWVLIRFDKLVETFDENRRRVNGKTGTEFYYWPYTESYIKNRGKPINILKFAENYSIP